VKGKEQEKTKETVITQGTLPPYERLIAQCSRAKGKDLAESADELTQKESSWKEVPKNPKKKTTSTDIRHLR